MLEVKEVSKIYRSGSRETVALDGISITFRSSGLVAILGPSGSGKTTLLNVLGGIDRASCGDIIIRGRSTESFTEREWDSYRKHTVGFVFQNFHLLPDLTVRENIELNYSLSGTPHGKKRRETKQLISLLGIADIADKKPGELSNGQMQRVAIARAMAGDPPILLCDEPTGSMDSASGDEIMEILQKVSRKRLVIVVTHNEELADLYADRIVRLKDGDIIADDKPYRSHASNIKPLELAKTRMDFLSVAKLALHHLFDRKGRALLAVLGSSIGLISLALLLAVTSGFRNRITGFNTEVLSDYPVVVSTARMRLTEEESQKLLLEIPEERQTPQAARFTELEAYEDYQEVYPYLQEDLPTTHTNVIDQAYLDFVEKTDSRSCQAISYIHNVHLNLLRNDGGSITDVTVPYMDPDRRKSISSADDAGFQAYPADRGESQVSFLESNYELIAGEYPSKSTDLMILTDSMNRVPAKALTDLGIVLPEDMAVPFDEILGRELYLVHNDDYYVQVEGEVNKYTSNPNMAAAIGSGRTRALRVRGILRPKNKASAVDVLGSGIIYSSDLVDEILKDNVSSQVVVAQRNSGVNVLTGSEVNEEQKNRALTHLGGYSIPTMIVFYPRDYEHRLALLEYLDSYNADRELSEKVLCTDLSRDMADTTRNIMNGIIAILVFFTILSLIISAIVLFIMMYTSSMGRRREVGILRALGARRLDIIRVFDLEAVILGLLSGIVGAIASMILVKPLNNAIHTATGFISAAYLKSSYLWIIVFASTVLAVIAGHGPAHAASRKEAAEILSTE